MTCHLGRSSFLVTLVGLAVSCAAIESPTSQTEIPDAESIRTTDAAQVGIPDAARSTTSDAVPDAPCPLADCACQGLTDCAGACVDTQTDPVHCSGCDRRCADDRRCTSGKCLCVEGQDCDGVCVTDFQFNDTYCGSCNRPCATGKEVCVRADCRAMESVAIAEILEKPGDPTGWIDVAGNPIRFSFRNVGATSARYECQTLALAFAQSVEFGPCDGVDGTRPEHQPAPLPDYPDGAYRTSVRVRIGSYVSGVVSHDYYVHNSLNKAQPCVSPFTDEQYFAFAATALGTVGAFPATTVVRNPFIEVLFQNVNYSSAYRRARIGQALPATQQFTTPSLRRKFVLSYDNKLLLVRRAFESRQALKDGRVNARCQDPFEFGDRRAGLPRQRVHCDALILSSSGYGICVGPNATNPSQLVTKVASAQAWTKLIRQDRFSPKAKAPCGQPWTDSTRAPFLCLPQ